MREDAAATGSQCRGEEAFYIISPRVAPAPGIVPEWPAPEWERVEVRATESVKVRAKCEKLLIRWHSKLCSP